MPDISKFEEYVYKAIAELIKIRPDGELTYTRVLTCYLNGQASKEIPWEAIQKSKIHGKFPKANLLTVMMACNKLSDCGYLNRIKVDSNYKYFLTDLKLGVEQKPRIFSEKISKYKKYLLTKFSDYLTKICPFLKGIEHEKYYGFINKNPVYYNEFNWIWITDESQEPNTLKVFMRERPNIRRISATFILSQRTFFTVVGGIIDILEDEKSKYKLIIHPNVQRPVIQGPVIDKKAIDIFSENVTIDFSFFYIDSLVFLNDGSEKAINAALSTSESSPYKYGGDTLFSPKNLKKTVQEKSSFDFSFVKWKVVAWTISNTKLPFIKNVLLVSKKTKNLWIVVSVPKKRVVCITTDYFEIEAGEKKVFFGRSFENGL